jgi:hypothetical protein
MEGGVRAGVRYRWAKCITSVQLERVAHGRRHWQHVRLQQQQAWEAEQGMGQVVGAAPGV